MGADYDNLRAFLLASTKAHLGNRYAISLLNTQIKTLSDRINEVAPVTDPKAKAILDEIQREIEESLTDLDDRTEALLAALEVYVNG